MVLLAVFVVLFYKLKIKRKRVQCKLLLLFIKFLLKGKKKTRFCYILQMWTREVMEEIWRYFSLKSVISAITPCHPNNLFVGLSVCLIDCLFVLGCCLWWCCWSLPKCHWRVNIPGAQQQGRSAVLFIWASTKCKSALIINRLCSGGFLSGRMCLFLFLTLFINLVRKEEERQKVWIYFGKSFIQLKVSVTWLVMEYSVKM